MCTTKYRRCQDHAAAVDCGGRGLACISLTRSACHATQTEKAFQKQLGVNGGWVKPARRTPGKGGLRYYKNVGLGFKTPKEAIEGGFCGSCW